MKVMVREAKRYSRKSLAMFMAMCMLLSCVVTALFTTSIGEVNAEGYSGNKIYVNSDFFDYYYDDQIIDNNSTTKSGTSKQPYSIFNSLISNSGSTVSTTQMQPTIIWYANVTNWDFELKSVKLSLWVDAGETIVDLLPFAFNIMDDNGKKYIYASYTFKAGEVEKINNAINKSSTINYQIQYVKSDGSAYSSNQLELHHNEWKSGQTLIKLDGVNTQKLEAVYVTNTNSNSCLYTTPLYFGQYWIEGEDAAITTTYNATSAGEQISGAYNPVTLNNFWWGANLAFRPSATYDNANSNAAQYHTVAQGIVDSRQQTEITGNSTISQNNKVLPYFSKEWISANTNKYNGNAVADYTENVQFPFYEYIDANGVKHYRFDSNEKVVNINKSTSKVTESTNFVYDSTTESKGFFPFNTSTDTSEALNYGFGVRFDIDFSITESGTINGEDIKFTFKGDDDVWVFIDDQLVLDMGGGHKDAEGYINFRTGDAVINYASNAQTQTIKGDTLSTLGITQNKTVNIYGGNGSPLNLNLKDGKTHKITMYYMERGMLNSNLYVDFNIITENTLVIDNVLDTSGVGEFFIDETLKVAEKDVFNYSLLNSGTTKDDITGSGYLYPTYEDISRINNGITTVLSNSSGASYIDYLYVDASSIDPSPCRLAVYLYGNNVAGIWRNMENYSGNIYRVDVTGYTDFILCRMNPAYTTNGWNTGTETNHIWNRYDGTVDTSKLWKPSWGTGTKDWASTMNATTTTLDTVTYPNKVSTANSSSSDFDPSNGNTKVKNTNYALSDKIIGKTVIGQTDDNGGFNLLYSQSATFVGQFAKNSNMTVIQNDTFTTQGETPTDGVTSLEGESNRTVSKYYTTTYDIIDKNKNKVTFTETTDVNNNTTTAFTFANVSPVTRSSTDDSGSVKINETITNTVKTGTLTITKDTNEESVNKSFTFKVYFSDTFDGGFAEKLYSGNNAAVTGTGDFNQSTGVITLEKGESVTISGIPVGTAYKIVETTTGDYYKVTKVATTIGGTTTNVTDGSKEATGEIPTDTNSAVSVTYTNKLFRDITIEKVVYENDGTTEKNDDTTEFTFAIEFTNQDGRPYTESVEYEGSKSGTVKDGSGTIKITSSQTVTFKDVPIDVTCTITETSIPTGYEFMEVIDNTTKTTYDDATVTDSSTSDVTYLFNNKLSVATIQIKKYIDYLYYGNKNNPHGFSNYSLVGNSTTNDPYGYESYTDAEQSFIFEIEKLDSDGTSKGKTYVVLKFGSNLPPLGTAENLNNVNYNYMQESDVFKVEMGYKYKITEITGGVAWRYTFKASKDNITDEATELETVIIDFTNNGTSNSTTDAIVSFYNTNNESQIEGDMSSASNPIYLGEKISGTINAG